MADAAYSHWEDPDREPDYQEAEEERPRDPYVDVAKASLREFFEHERHQVFYKRQLAVMFEDSFYHWVTDRALSELGAEGHIVSEMAVKGQVL